MSGAWRISYSLYSYLGSGQANHAYLYLNNYQLDETKHDTYSYRGGTSTGGRVVNLEVSAGDRIYLRATRMDAGYYDVIFCAEFIR